MPVAISCACGHVTQVENTSAGQVLACSTCGRALVIPAFDVFVSYSSKEMSVADAVCQALEAQGLRCWIAPRNIFPGQEWSAAIIDGIEQSRAFVLVYTANSNESRQVLNEVERAVNHGLPLVTFRMENVKPTKALELFLSSRHWLDAVALPLDGHLAKLAADVKQLLSDQPAQPEPAAGDWRAALPAAVRSLFARDRRPRVLLGLTVFLLLAAVALAAVLYAFQPATASAEVIQAKAQAENLWEQVKDLDRQQGMGPRLDAVGERLRQGATLFDQKQFREALTEFRQVVSGGEELAAADEARRQARAARDEADKVRRDAEAGRVAVEAADAWAEADRMARQADEAFAAGHFGTAIDQWKASADLLTRATRRAALAATLKVHREEFRKYDPRFVEEAGDDGREAVRLAADAEMAADAGDIARAEERFREAIRLQRQAVVPRLKYLAHEAGVIAEWLWRVKEARRFGGGNDGLDYQALLMMRLEDEALRPLAIPADLVRRLRVEADPGKFPGVVKEVAHALDKAHGEEVAWNYITAYDLGILRYQFRFAVLELAGPKSANLLKMATIVCDDATRARYPKDVLAQLSKVEELIGAARGREFVGPATRLLQEVSRPLHNFDEDLLPLWPVERGVELLRGAQAVEGASTFAGKTVEQWQAQLGSDRLSQRRGAALALSHLGAAAKPALPRLAELLRDKELTVRAVAVTSLPRIDPSVSAVAEALADEHPLVRWRAARALESLGPTAKDAAPALTEALRREQNESVRKAVVKALGQVGAEARETIPALIEILRQKDSTVLAAAEEGLAKFGSDAVPALTKALQDDDFKFREQVARVLGRIGLPARDAAPALAALVLKFKSQQAVAALGRIGPDCAPAVAAVARTLVDDKGTGLSYGALGDGVLKQWGKAAVPALAETLKDPDPLMRQGAALALGRLKEDARDALPALAAAAEKDAEKKVRLAAIDALGNLKTEAEAAVAALAGAAKDADPQVRPAALRALGRLGGAAVPILLDTYKEKDPAAWTAAALALGQIGPDAKEAVPVLLKAREDARDYKTFGMGARSVIEGALKKIDSVAAKKAGIP